jgi:hypothetical protein
MKATEMKPAGPDHRSDHDALLEMRRALAALPDRHVCTCDSPAEQVTAGGRHIYCTSCNKVVRGSTLALQSVLMLEASRGDA